MASNDLTPFVLKNVKGLDSGEKKGSGAYGAVYEVTVKGVTCIAKRLHDILVTQVSLHESAAIQKKFAAECALLSKLRHPNVVHFVGVYYGKSENDLSLVMECLHTDLAKFLEGFSREIPLSIKLSILLDVSYGLLYFHTQTPPIIHRDLSANNVLLTTDLRAKIADLGVAKLLDPPKQVAIAQTKAPGSLHYMPPEALRENPVYNLKLDIFSYGHLMLYVATQKSPDVHELDDKVMYAALQQSTVQLQRRRKAIECIGGERHALYPLITQCLQDKLEHRPTTTELNDSLIELCTKYPQTVTEVFKQADKEESAKLAEDIDTLRRDNQQLKEALNDANIWSKGLRELVEKLQTWKRLKEEGEVLHNDDLPQEKGSENELKRTFSDQHLTIQRLLKEKEELQIAVQIAKTEIRIAELTAELNEVTRQHDTLDDKFLSLLAVNEKLKNKVSQIDCMQDDITKVKQEASKWKSKLSSQGAELSKLRVKTEVLSRENDDLKEEAEAQKVKLESCNKELEAERNKFCKELDKAKKDTEKAKAEAEKHKREAEKLRKDAKRKRLDKLAVSPEPRIALEFTELESRNEELVAERNKLRKELDKAQKELEKARKDTEKAKAEAEKQKEEAKKLKKDAKRKGLDKLAVPPEPRIALEEPSQSPRMLPVPSQEINTLQEMMKKDEGSKQDQTPCYERSTLQKSPSSPRLSSPNTPEIYPVISLTSGPSPRKQPQTHQVPQLTLQLQFPESPLWTHPKTPPIPIPQPVSSIPQMENSSS